MDEEEERLAKFWAKIGLGTVLLILVLVAGCMGGMPKYRLYRANVEKQAAIAEAKAQSDAEVYRAERAVTEAQYKSEADVIRAQGVAEANRVIAESLTDEYIRWYYVDQIKDSGASIIYVPTEGGIPLLESGRAVGPR